MSNKKAPIAIIGIGCRFPGGAANPRQFWRNLCRGKDAITDVPAERWDIRRFYDPNPNKPGKTYAKQGGFLKEKIDQFDPLFFGISPREAETMDPQQRLLLEVTWEAIEDAGLQAETLQGSRTGVFIGGFMLDNLLLRVSPMSREYANTHTGVSCTMTMLSNRISYTFDLQGPSVSMDTACSSSLVAAHYACQSIWNGESDMVMTGGVNMMLRPEFPIVMSKGKFLSTHSRCMAFDARAGGYARGEGAGIVILKPLDAALADRDHIYALIKMTGSNQDGRTAGISLPNPRAQEHLIREVYQNAGVSPSDVHYVEAHGTGTQAGDPRELQALHAVLSENRDLDNKCIVGSVKTNIGHLEAAAGVAGLIKASYCMEQAKIPPNLHFETPNPNIPLDEMCLRIPTSLEEWPNNGGTRLAGINSFGYGGTNAHILIEQAPVQEDKDDRSGQSPDGPWLVPISARSENALRDIAGKYAFFLSSLDGHNALADFLHTLCYRRSHHQHRLAFFINNPDELREKLQIISTGEQIASMATGTVEESNPALVFIYTGMGPQWWGMGRELMEQEPVFMESLKSCDRVFQEESGWSILEELRKDEDASQVTKTEIAQPANFVIQVALTELWKSYGIEPVAVIGHSVGEVAAAYISGALTLEDAARVSIHRSRLQATTAGMMGGMLAAGLTEQEALSTIAGFDRVSIAAVNSPASVTLSGDREQLEQIARTLTERSVFNRFLQVEVAYHSPHMDSIEQDLAASLASLKPRKSRIPFYSTVTGDVLDGELLGRSYWWDNVRRAVHFKHGIETLLQKDFINFIEIGPHPVLGHSVKETATAAGKKVNLAASLNRKHPECQSMSESLARLYTLGFNPNWQRIIPPGGNYIQIPTYPWQREKFWAEPEASVLDRLGNQGSIFFNNPLPSPHPAWSVEVNDQFFPFLADHIVNEDIVFPGAAYVAAGLALCKQAGDNKILVLHDMEFSNILKIEPDRLQFLSIDYHAEAQRYSIYSRFQEQGSDWSLNAAGKLLLSEFDDAAVPVDLGLLKSRFKHQDDPEDMYRMLSDRGLKYGQHFRRVRELWTTDDEFLIRIDAEDTGGDYLLHPVILDACFHSVLTLVPGRNPYVPVSIDKVMFYKAPQQECWCHGTITNRTKSTIEATLVLTDEQGSVLAELTKSFYRALPNVSDHDESSADKLFYSPDWLEFNQDPQQPPAEISDCLLFTGDVPSLSRLEHELQRRKVHTARVIQGNTYQTCSDDCYHLEPSGDGNYGLLRQDLKDRKFSHVIYCWPILQQTDDYSADNISSHCMQLINLVQTLDTENEINLVILTQLGEVVTGKEEAIDLNNSPLWGLAPLIENEYPNIKYHVIDIDGDPELDLYHLITNYSMETDLAIRNNQLYVKSLERLQLPGLDREPVFETITTEEPVRLLQLRSGQIDSLAYERNERIAPSECEVEIKTHSACLNFKDVLKVYGTLSDKVTRGTYFGNEIGMEICGTVTRAGNGVTEFKPGDMVVAPIAGGFRSYATLPKTYLMPIPPSIEPGCYFIHIGYLTAYYGLIKIANLQPDEKVLIHSATGGLGLAAIQIAKWKGAEIFATAGTEEKREYLRSLGIQHVMNSRNLEFTRKIIELTGGCGIDVVLNSLSGDALKEGFSLLAPYGRFIEVGKKEISENDGLPMSTFNRNITFAAIDIDRMHAERPELVREMLAEIDRAFRAGHLTSIPTRFYDSIDTVDAFRHMAHAEHIGKIVVRFKDGTVKAVQREQKQALYRKDGSYLITGGTSGFGLEVAKWIANSGGGRVILVSRSGAATDSAKTAIAEMKAGGTDVQVERADVGQRAQVEELIGRIQTDGPPLRGVFHAAMVLDDAFLKDMQQEKFNRVLAPKVSGMLNLYHHTREMKLDFFVSFSSISALIGNRGQANYVAANYFLDEFSKFTRSKGFPAISINWGVLQDSGILARNNELAKLFEQEGIFGLSNRTALTALDRILTAGSVQAGVFDIDWERWGQANNRVSQTSRFRRIVNSSSNSGGAGINQNMMHWLEILEGNPEPESNERIAEAARIGLAKVLRLPPEKIGMDQKLDGLGIDSLILLELSLSIRDTFGIDISAAELFKQPTITSLSHEIISRLEKGRPKLN